MTIAEDTIPYVASGSEVEPLDFDSAFDTAWGDGGDASDEEPEEVSEESEPTPAVTDDEDESAAEPPTETPEHADLSEHMDRLVTVKVDGEEVEVPLREALDGYSRTSTFHRKTQALAEQRKEAEDALSVWQSLQEDPKVFAERLIDTFDLNYELVPKGAARPQQSDDLDDLDDSYTTPRQASAMTAPDAELKQQLAEMQEQINRMETQKRLGEAMSEAGAILSRYGVKDLSPKEVVEHAVKNQIPSIETAARDLMFDPLAEQVTNRKSANRGRAKAASLVTSTRTAAGAVGKPAEKITDFESAFAAAEKQAGIKPEQYAELV